MAYRLGILVTSQVPGCSWKSRESKRASLDSYVDLIVEGISGLCSFRRAVVVMVKARRKRLALIRLLGLNEVRPTFRFVEITP